MRPHPPAWLLALLILTLPVLSAAVDGDPAPKETVDQLIQQLNHNNYRERDLAVRALLQREESLAQRTETSVALRQALNSRQAEIARRATQLLDVFAHRARQRRLERLRKVVETGAVDQMIDLVADWPPGQDEKQCWAGVGQFTTTVLKLAEKRGVTSKLIPASIETNEQVQVLSASQNSPLFRPFISLFLVRLRKADVAFTEFTSSTVVSSDVVRMPRFTASVLLAGGSVEAEGKLHCSLVVCAGKLSLRSLAFKSILIARGPLTLERSPVNSLICSGEAVKFTGAPNPQVPIANKPRECVVVENEPRPLGFVQFFELAREGLTVTPGKGGVLVQAVDATRRLGKIGLRSGDLIVAADREPASSPAVLRRLLCRGSVRDDGLILQVRRAGKMLPILVPPI